MITMLSVMFTLSVKVKRDRFVSYLYNESKYCGAMKITEDSKIIRT